jgi:hypothetical protein
MGVDHQVVQVGEFGVNGRGVWIARLVGGLPLFAGAPLEIFEIVLVHENPPEMTRPSDW